MEERRKKEKEMVGLHQYSSAILSVIFSQQRFLPAYVCLHYFKWILSLSLNHLAAPSLHLWRRQQACRSGFYFEAGHSVLKITLMNHFRFATCCSVGNPSKRVSYLWYTYILGFSFLQNNVEWLSSQNTSTVSGGRSLCGLGCLTVSRRVSQ